MLNEQNDSSILQTWLRAAIDKMAGEPVQDSSKKFSDELAHFTGEFLKTIPLFMPSVGKRVAALCYAASAVLNGLDQVKAGDSLDKQVKDSVLGMSKGLGVKGSFDALGTVNFNKVNSLVDAGLAPTFLNGKPPELLAKAFSFGISSRSRFSSGSVPAGDKNVLAMSRTLVSKDTLESFVKDSNKEPASHALRRLFELFLDRAEPVMLDAAINDASLRFESLEMLFYSHSVEQLRQLSKIVDKFNNSINARDRISLVTALTGFIPDQSVKLDKGLIARTEMRIAMAKKLAEPLQTGLFRDLLGKLDQSSQRFRKASA